MQPTRWWIAPVVRVGLCVGCPAPTHAPAAKLVLTMCVKLLAHPNAAGGLTNAALMVAAEPAVHAEVSFFFFGLRKKEKLSPRCRCICFCLRLCV